MNNIFFLMMVFLVSGCGTLGASDAQKKLILKKDWVRSSISDDYLLMRKSHRMTPLHAGSLLIQGNAIQGLVAYNKTTGDAIWERNISGGVHAGAVFKDGKLYFGASDGQFYCLQAHDGQVLWSYPTRSETLSIPLVEEGMVYFLTGENILYSLEADSGKKNWLYARQDAQTLSIMGGGTPAIYKDKLFVGFSDGSFVALNKKTGNLIWERTLNKNKRFRDIDSSPVIEGEIIYISGYDDQLYALNVEDGSISWRVQYGGFVPVTLTPQKIFYSTSDGKVLALDKKSGKTLWNYDLKDGVATRVIYQKGKLFFGESAGALVILDAESGKLLTSFYPGRGVFSTPLVDEDKVYFISNDANLYALTLTWENAALKLPWEK